KEFAVKVKDLKRKRDSDDDEDDDDDDDEGPSAGSNQGKSAKRRRHDSGASGSAQPPPKDDEQSSKKPHDSDASASKQHLTLNSTGWQNPFTRTSYNYLGEIILRRAAYKEYKILEKDLKNLHPNDFEDLYLLNIQDKLNHLSKSHKIHLHTAVNIWIRNLVIRNRVGDLQLRIESYQTMLNLERVTPPDGAWTEYVSEGVTSS
ncbi:hypothetical protein Tco_0166620, partial [Tanacetum coccineum]